MISRFAITNPQNTAVKWLPKCKFFAKPKEFTFTDGLNILWGQNGSGKSTLLKLIAKMFHAEQGGISTITVNSFRELFGYEIKSDGAGADHDGQGIIYYDPSVKVGLMGGGFAFDDDFFESGIRSAMIKGSAGELTIDGLGQALRPLLKKEKFFIEPDYRVSEGKLNNLYKGQLESTKEFFKPSIEVGKPTILLDEADRSLDIPAQKKHWEMLGKQNRMQLIVATHSVFACNIPGANYIEFTPGYLQECREALKSLRQ